MHMLKKTLWSLILVFGVWHCLAIALLILPKNPLTRHYSHIVGEYSLPLFPQVWLVFGPQFRGHQQVLEYRCLGEKWSTWLDPMTPLALKYQRQRFSEAGYLYRLLEDRLRKTHNEMVETKKADYRHIQKTLQELCKRSSMELRGLQARIIYKKFAKKETEFNSIEKTVYELPEIYLIGEKNEKNL